MSETPAMDDEIHDYTHLDDDGEEAIGQGLVANTAENMTPGEMLREARLAHDYSIPDLSSHTMLSRHTLEALEDDRFEQLAQPVFARGYYRKCAKVLEMNADALLAAYAAVGGARSVSQPEPVTPVDIVPADVTPDRRRSFGTIFGVIILLIAVLAIYLFWAGSTNTLVVADNETTGIELAPETSSPDTPAGTANSTTSLATVLAQADEPAPAGGGGPDTASRDAGAAAGAQSGGSASAAAGATRSPSAGVTANGAAVATTAGPGAAETAPTDANSQSAATESAPTTATTTSAGAAGTPPASAAGATALTLKFDERSWVDVRDATGRQLLVGIYQDTTRELDGVPPYDVVIGYAPGVEVLFGGEPVDVDMASNNTARFTVGAGGG